MNPIDPSFEALLVHLKEARGFDFTGYKRSSLMRRVSRRLAQLGISDYGEYLDHLQVYPDEFTVLFNTILINVTGFFRDPETWEYLRDQVLRPLVEKRAADSPIRVWSAGCASGEEAYTLAIVLAEVLGADEFRRRVKIYATDVDEEGLTEARHASYSEHQVRGVPDDLLERYFDRAGNRYVFRKELRRSVIFGRNDLVQDAPISRIDLVACRNTLMYLNAETQARIIGRFHFALVEDGVLLLGKAETLLSHSEQFAAVEVKRRIFRKVTRAGGASAAIYAELPRPGFHDDLLGLDQLRVEAFLASPVAQIVVTADGLVALSNRQAESLLGVSPRDVGRLFRDLDVSYRPVELRRPIEQVQAEGRPTRITGLEYARAPGDTVHLEIQVNPLIGVDSSLLGVTLVFHEVTEFLRLRDELEDTNRQLETAYEELQSTNEELETTNEELQSTVEELETTNEELQSTNEELETTNEELQSTNDELQTINDELRQRSSELDDTNAFLEAVLTSLRAGVTVLDRQLHIRAWNKPAEELWGLRRDEAIGQHFLNLDIGLPIDQLRPALRAIFSDGGRPVALSLPAVNRRGRPITVRVVCSPLAEGGSDVTGVVLVMERSDDANPPHGGD